MKHNFMTDDRGALWRYGQQNSGYYGLTDGVMLRPGFAVHHETIDNGPQLVSSLRAGKYAWPGGYALAFVTSDGALLSFEAVKDNLYQVIYSIRYGIDDGWRVNGLVSLGDMDDDESYTCDHYGTPI